MQALDPPVKLNMPIWRVTNDQSLSGLSLVSSSNSVCRTSCVSKVVHPGKYHTCVRLTVHCCTKDFASACDQSEAVPRLRRDKPSLVWYICQNTNMTCSQLADTLGVLLTQACHIPEQKYDVPEAEHPDMAGHHAHLLARTCYGS